MQSRRLIYPHFVVAALLQIVSEVTVLVVSQIDYGAVCHRIMEVKELLNFALLDAHAADIIEHDSVSLFTEPH